MPDSEIKILRDELARVIAESDKKDGIIADRDRAIVGLAEQLAEASVTILMQTAQINWFKQKGPAPGWPEGEPRGGTAPDAQTAALEAENQQLRQHIRYYENPHTPSSQNSIPTRQKKAAAAKASGNVPAPAKAKPGRRQGHEGVSHARKPTLFVKHYPKKCGKCGSTNMKKPKKIFSKLVTDTPKRPEPVTTQHTAYRRKCADCGNMCIEDDRSWNVPGTEFGPNITGMMAAIRVAPASIQATATLCSEILGIEVSEAGVLQCLRAGANAIKPGVESIRQAIRDSDYLHIDETAMPYNGRTARIWVVVGRNRDGTVAGVHTLAAPSRGRAVVDMNFPYYDKPVTVDGYGVYAAFKTRQWCWAHILREAREAGKTSRKAHALYGTLKKKFIHAKGLGPPEEEGAARHDMLVAETRGLAEAFGREAGCESFATKLGNASEFLYTFTLHPGMEPTNNLAERMLRPSVIARKVFQGLRTMEGMEMFTVLMTCAMNWRARGCGVREMLVKTLTGSVA